MEDTERKKKKKKKSEKDTGGIEGQHVKYMSVHTCRSVSVDEIAKLAEKAKEGGAKTMEECESEQPGPLLQKFLDSVKGSVAGKKEGKKAPKVVHVVSNLPPLPGKIVELIQEGSFVDFAWFPVLEEGPSDGEWKPWQNDTMEGGQANPNHKKKGWKEVPDLSWWSTCFSLFQVAWAREKPEMWEPLTAYREIIFKLARRHHWVHVVKYDRRFRQEAAGKTAKWDEERVTLLFDIIYNSPNIKSEGKLASGGGGPSQRKGDQKRKAACFRFNRANGSCMFGAQCRFAHICSSCGADHPVSQCRTGERSLT